MKFTVDVRVQINRADSHGNIIPKKNESKHILGVTEQKVRRPQNILDRPCVRRISQVGSCVHSMQRWHAEFVSIRRGDQGKRKCLE